MGATLAGAVGIFARHDLTRFEITEESMAPSLRAGDYVIVRRFHHPPERGDIVVFDDPRNPGFRLVKRVVAVGGDTVHLEDEVVTVDGEPDPYGSGHTSGAGRWILDADEVFVLGDNRPLSASDSRVLGPLAAGDIPWRVTWRYWPPRRIGTPQ